MKRFFTIVLSILLIISFSIPIVKAQLNPGSVMLIGVKLAELLAGSDKNLKTNNKPDFDPFSEKDKKAITDNGKQVLKAREVYLLDPLYPVKMKNNGVIFRYQYRAEYPSGKLENGVSFVACRNMPDNVNYDCKKVLFATDENYKKFMDQDEAAIMAGYETTFKDVFD